MKSSLMIPLKYHIQSVQKSYLLYVQNTPRIKLVLITSNDIISYVSHGLPAAFPAPTLFSYLFLNWQIDVLLSVRPC